MSYCHTQKCPLSSGFYFAAAALAIGAWIFRNQPPVMLVLIGVAVTLFLVALLFGQLTVRDEGEHLSIRYGPLAVFRKRIAYSAITSVEPGRSSIIDGWGIHYVPGRGMTYNLWGRACVKLRVGGNVIRIGSDDVDNLAEFLRGRIAAEPPAR